MVCRLTGCGSPARNSPDLGGENRNIPWSTINCNDGYVAGRQETDGMSAFLINLIYSQTFSQRLPTPARGKSHGDPLNLEAITIRYPAIGL